LPLVARSLVFLCSARSAPCGTLFPYTTLFRSEAGSLRMYTLFAARRPVASVYGVVHARKFNYYQSGYDPNWSSRSVGLVLLARTDRKSTRLNSSHAEISHAVFCLKNKKQKEGS